VNKNEKEVVKKYVKEGYKYLHSGWPDFVFFKVDENGNIIKESIRFVEVKLKGNGLRYEQGVMEKIFKSLDLPFSIEFVDSTPLHSTPNHSIPGHSIPCQSNPIQSIPIQSNPSHSKPNHTNPKEVILNEI
jgi:hypothetical protein